MAYLRAAPVGIERVYVWEKPVRVAHWVMFFSILILSGTGYYLAHPFISVPDPAKEHFVMGLVRTVHMYTAIAFILTLLVRIYWMFAGNKYARLSELIPFSRQRWSNLWDSVLFFSFLKRNPASYTGHDALAGATYGALFALYLVKIATGLALYTVTAPVDSPLQFFRILEPVFGGLQGARLIHHVCMWLVLVVAVIHIYSVFLWSSVERAGEVDSMFSGYKFVKRKQGRP